MRKIFTLAQTGKMLGKSPKAIRTLMSLGKFPFSKIGGRIFTEETELQKYLELSRKTTAEEAAQRVTATRAAGTEAA